MRCFTGYRITSLHYPVHFIGNILRFIYFQYHLASYLYLSIQQSSIVPIQNEWYHRSLYDLLVLSCTLYPVKFTCQIVPNTELRYIHFTNPEIVDRSNCNDNVTMKHFICLTLPAAHFRQIASYPPTPALELKLWELENWQLPMLPQSGGSTTHWARKTTHPVCAV